MDWAMTLSFCKIELIGTWLWVTGKTQPIKDMLKQKGFHWASRKDAWCFHVGLWRRNKKHFQLDDLRARYGYRSPEGRRRSKGSQLLREGKGNLPLSFHHPYKEGLC